MKRRSRIASAKRGEFGLERAGPQARILTAAPGSTADAVERLGEACQRRARIRSKSFGARQRAADHRRIGARP